jgi:phage shock protein PspC (stress-responsive transcriptional regulator)
VDPVKESRNSIGVAVGGVFIVFGAWLLLRTTGLVPSFIFDVLDRVSGPLTLIVVGVVFVIVARRAHAPEPGSRLYRSRTDKWVGGAFGGLGPYVGIDPVVLRLAFIALVIAGQGWMVIAYIVGWAIIPEEPAGPVPPLPAT